MFWLIIGLILFLGVHSVSIIDADWRNRTAARLGQVPWKAIYGLISLLGLYLIVIGYGQAAVDPIVLYQPPVWMRHITLLLMVPVFVLLLAAYLPGRIQRTTKHPMLLATKIWALAHLLANGTLADLLLFGGFLAWAVADRISLKRRAPVPVPAAPAGRFNDWIALGAGLALYVLFLLWAHKALFGVAPIG
ncbi:NnrU family protein [Lamprobacter modestohalophilus]|uniref:NnrU family protein n=1 Tax=Lamprobacter modestohalophilus TaxID=1064514 RepID=A0A9X1B3N7_9GAMM|nr:NnrU family protein [Lamprobacter modestohalophilus]MBK1617792.1 NnrU family protein [Lamprobacter modestohalophilus]